MPASYRKAGFESTTSALADPSIGWKREGRRWHKGTDDEVAHQMNTWSAFGAVEPSFSGRSTAFLDLPPLG